MLPNPFGGSICFQGSAGTLVRKIIQKLVAGERFERPMRLAYETGVVATLPAIFNNLVKDIGLEPMTPCLQSRCSPD